MNSPAPLPLQLDYPELRPILSACFGGASEFPAIPWYTGNAFMDFAHLVLEVNNTVRLGVGSYQLKNKLDPKYRSESVMYTGEVEYQETPEAILNFTSIWARQEDIQEVVDITRQVFLPQEDFEGAEKRKGYVRVEVPNPIKLTPSETAIYLGLSLKSYERALNTAFAITDVREDSLFSQAMKNFLAIVAQNHIRAYY